MDRTFSISLLFLPDFIVQIFQHHFVALSLYHQQWQVISVQIVCHFAGTQVGLLQLNQHFELVGQLGEGKKRRVKGRRGEEGLNRWFFGRVRARERMTMIMIMIINDDG